MAQKKPRIDEHQHQTNLFHWVSLNLNRYPELRFFHAIPNGAKLPYTRRADGSRFSRQAAFLKKEGLTSGVPDTCLPVARYVYHGLYIEMKAKDGKPTEEQVAFLNFLNDQGFLACLCYGSQAAITVLEWYLDLPRYLKPDFHVDTPAEAVIPQPPAKPAYIDLFSQD